MSLSAMKPKTNIGIFIFNQVEVLDFCGPFEVFSRTRLIPGVESRLSEASAPFHVFTLSKKKDEITCTGGLKVIPDYSFTNSPPIDILILPGGQGTRSLVNDSETIEWIRSTAAKTHQTASVCTGAFLLAKAGLLKNRKATTHWASFDQLQLIDSTIQILKDQRVVNDGIITSGGISAGIDMAFSLVEEMFGEDVANDTAHYMEYIRPNI